MDSRLSGVYSEEGESSTLGTTNSDGRPSLEEDSPGAPPLNGRHSQITSSEVRTADGDLYVRKPRARKGGGFLLQNMFHSSLRENRDRSSRHSLDLKGKKKLEVGRSGSGKAQKPYNLDGQPLHRSSPPTKTGTLQIDGSSSRGEMEDYSPKASNDNVAVASENPQTAEDRSSHQEEDAAPAPLHPTAAIDPTQIVNMALNLSENRRRQVSGSHLLMNPKSGGRRVVSAGSTAGIPTLQGRSQQGAGGSLKQYLQQQRRVSRNMSPGNGRRSTSARLMPNVFGYGSYLDAPGLSDASYGYQYHFSTATLARADKARRYIELAVEFRRLLQFLPPLKPDSNAPGNFTFSAASVPGSTNVELSKVPSKIPSQFELGRRYNPLQLVRNRKLRARSRNPLNPGMHAWEDPEEVRGWIDAVDQASRRPQYRGGEKVSLPEFPLGSEPNLPPSDHLSHQRSESQSKPKRPRQDWYVPPQELLADAYWLEQADHKYHIENALGNHLFAAAPETEPSKARSSYESRHSRNDSIAHSASSLRGESREHEPQNVDQRGRKRTQNHQLQDDGSGRLRSILQKARARSTSSSSDLSVSDDGSGKVISRITTALSLDYDNVGPLQRHMDKLLADGSLDANESPPMVASPGTPDKWGRRGSGPPAAHATDGETVPSPEDVTSQTGIIDFVEQPPSPSVDHHSQKASSIASPQQPISSPESTDFANLNGQAIRHIAPSIAVGVSPPSSRHQSPARKSRKGMLPFVWSDGKKDNRKAGAKVHATGDTDDHSSRVLNDEIQPRSSIEPASPVKVKHLFSHRPNDSVSSLASRPGFQEKDMREGKEHESAVRRFLKGGRIGDIVRHEGAKVGDFINVRKKDSPRRETFEGDSDRSTHCPGDSDSEEDINPKPVKGKAQPVRLTADASRKLRETRINDRPSRYHLDLPTFRSTSDRQDSSRPGTPGEDHISSQLHVLQGNRSPRFDRLAPPGLDLSRVTSHASTAPVLSRSATLTGTLTAESIPDGDSRWGSYGFPHLRHIHSRSRDRRRIKATLDIPGQATGRSGTGLPHTALTDLRADRSSSRQRLADRRHWSISDQQRSRSPRAAFTAVSKTDVARVRALLLCSGIKAAALARRAHTPPMNGPSKFLVNAARTANMEPRLVNRDQEHILASQLLSTSLEKDTASLRALARHFRDATISTLRQNIEDLRGVVESCVDRSRGLSDDAAAFGGEISGQGTIDARRVMDSLNKLKRTQRRRLRWLRRVGFGLLEWSVLLIMWWVWLIVVVVKTMWNILGGVGSVVKWLLWLK